MDSGTKPAMPVAPESRAANLRNSRRDWMRYLRWYREIAPGDMRWMMVEASDRILPEVSESMSVYTVKALRRRGMVVHSQRIVLGMERENEPRTVPGVPYSGTHAF